MKEFGLLGYPLGHSFSKKYFDKKINDENVEACFNNYELEDAVMMSEFVEKSPDLKGFAITLPHKEAVIALLNEQDEAIDAIGAVNCVKVDRIDGKPFLKGYNTDVIGFELSFREFLKPEHRSALVLGTGGAAKAVKFVLKKLNIDFKVVSRQKTEEHLCYEDITPELLKNTSIIINTTPLGMYPKIENCPLLPYEALDESHYCYDLVYNPLETLFLKKAKAQGAAIKAGMDMLELQAEANWEIWNA